MSFLGKILIVVQVVLSFCFMAFAGAVYTGQINWKAKSEKTQADLTKAQSDASAVRADLDKQLNAMQNERDQAITRAGTAETDLQAAQARLTRLETDLKTVDTLKGELSSEAQLAQEEAKARIEEVLNARDVNNELNDAQRDLIKRLRTAEDSLFALQKEMQEMERKHNEALNEIATWKIIAQKNNWIKDPTEYALGQAPPPVVRGYVIETRDANARGTEKLIEISLGQRDGLAENHELFIYRPASRNAGRGMYLGKIRLVNVTANRSVGMVVEQAKTGIIEKDDHVTTQL